MTLILGGGYQLPAGGTVNQVIAKNSALEGDAKWRDLLSSGINAKRFASTAAAVTISSTGDVFAEWQVPGRLQFAAVVGDLIDAELLAGVARVGTAFIYLDYGIINPTTGAVIRRSSPGDYGHANPISTNFEVPVVNGTFVVQTGDIVNGLVTVNVIIRSNGGMTVYGPPNYGFVTKAVHYPGATGGLPQAIQDEGVALTQRPVLNFVGAGVTATDDATGLKTVVTIPGSSVSALNVSRSNLTTTQYNTTLTLGAEPYQNSLLIWRNGLLMSAYSMAGAVVTFSPSLNPGDKVAVQFWSITSAAAPVLSGDASPIRGTQVITGTGSSAVAAFPAGTVAGDIAILYAFIDSTETSPSPPVGWTSLNTSSSFGGQRSAYRVLSAGDITTGSVTVTYAVAGNNSLSVTTAAKVSAVQIAHARAINTVSSGLASGAALAGDLLLWLGISRAGVVPNLPSRTATQSGSAVSTGISGVVRTETLTSAETVSAAHELASLSPCVTLGCIALR